MWHPRRTCRGRPARARPRRRPRASGGVEFPWLRVRAAPRTGPADAARPGAPWLARAGLPADDPESPAVPVEPDGRLPRPVFGVVSQVGIQRPGQELVQVKDFTVPTRYLGLNDLHSYCL